MAVSASPSDKQTTRCWSTRSRLWSKSPPSPTVVWSPVTNCWRVTAWICQTFPTRNWSTSSASVRRPTAWPCTVTPAGHKLLWLRTTVVSLSLWWLRLRQPPCPPSAVLNLAPASDTTRGRVSLRRGNICGTRPRNLSDHFSPAETVLIRWDLAPTLVHTVLVL